MTRILTTITFIILIISGQKVLGQCPEPVVPIGDTNLVINGGFETSDILPSNAGSHIYVPPTCNCSSPGRYTVGGLSQSFNVGLINGVTPHSGSYMLMIDNVTAPNAIAWEQTINVQPNTVYYFSSWLTALSPVEKSEMIFQVEAGSITSDLGDYFIPPNGPTWEQYFGTWNSGANTTATIRLINTNPTASGGGGNDYAIDDITFSPSCVGVDAGPVPDLGGTSISLCNWGGTVDLNSNVPDFVDHTYTWYYEGTKIDTNIVEPDILSDQYPLGTYVACVDSSGCVNSDSIEVVADLVIDFGPDVDLCDPATKLLNTDITVPGNFSISWYKDNVVIPSETETTYLAVGAGTYRVDVVDLVGGGVCDGTDEIVITSSVPEPVGDTICVVQGDDDANLSVIGSGRYKWWDAETGGTSVGVGSTLNLTGLTGPVTYYVNDTTEVGSTAGFPDESTFGGNGFDPNIDYATMKFTALGNGTFESATALLQGSGPFTVTFTNVTTSTTIVDNSQTGGAGYVNVIMNYPLVAGNQYTISVTRSGQVNYFWPSSGVSFPIAYDLVQLDGGVIANFPTALFDWQLSAPSSCSRVPVEVEEICVCNGPLGITLTNTGNDTVCIGGSFNEVIEARVSNPDSATFVYDFYRNGVLEISSLDSNYTVTQPGQYYVSISNQSEPTCLDVSSVISFIEEDIPTASAGTDTTLCISSPDYTLDGSVTVVSGGTWSGGAGGYNSSATDLNAIYSPVQAELDAGQVTLILTADNGNECIGTTDEITIFFDTIPYADAGINDTICEDGLASLNGSIVNGTNGEWLNGTGGYSTNNTDLSVDYTPSSTEISAGFVELTLNVTDVSVCPAVSDVIRIVIDEIPTTDAGADQNVCVVNPETTLAGIVTNALGGTWSGSGGFVSNTDLGTIYTPSSTELSAGTATITLTSDDNGKCSGTTDDMTITIDPSVPVSVSIDTLSTQCVDEPVIFGIISVSGEGVSPSYNWMVNSAPQGISSDFIANGLNDGDVVSLRLTSDHDCPADAQVNSNDIVVALKDCKCPDLIIPNAFTPNNDMLNDVWEIEIDNCYEYHNVTIYNRYGNIIFSSTNYSQDTYWTGKRNGKDIGIGTYYYIIETKKKNEESEFISGGVTIVK